MLSHIQVPENVKEIINDPTGKMCNFDSFLLSFNNMYIQNPDFRNSLIIGLCKGIVSKLHGRMNPQWTSRVLDFSNVIRLKSPSAYRFIADNLLSPSIRHLGRITSNIDHDSIFNIEKSAIIKRVDIWVNNVLDECSDSKLICSLSGDATKVAKMFSVDPTTKIGYGRIYPNQMMISSDGTEFMSTNNDLDLADEVKCFLLSAQNSKKECSPVKMITARSQSSNENCPDYNNLLIDTLVKHPKIKLISVSFDGLSNEAQCIRNSIVDYLMGKSNFIGLMDINHVAKAMRSQLVLGSSIVKIGDSLFDPGLFQEANVNSDLFRVKDFTSDKIVLQLCSRETMLKLLSLENEENSLVGATCLSIFF